MPNPTLPVDGSGAVTWFNDQNNWRAADADWLQSHAIIRWLTAADRTAASASHKAPGSVGYIVAGAGQFVFNVGGTDRYPFFANNLAIPTDTTSAVNLKLTGAGTTSIQLEPNKVSVAGLGASGSFVAGPLTVTNTVVRISNTTDNSSVDLTKDPLVGGVAGTGPLRIAGGLRVTSGVLFDTTLGVTGATQLGSLTASALATFSAGVNVTGGVISGTLGSTSSVNISGSIATTSTVTVGTPTGGGGMVVSNGAVAKGPTSAVVSDIAGITLRTNYDPVTNAYNGGNLRSKIADGSAQSANIASVIVSSAAPAPSDDYPEGCLWVQV